MQVNEETKSRIHRLIQKLNHRARVLESSYGKVDVKRLVNTGLFNLERAQTGYGWLQDLHAMTLREVSPLRATIWLVENTDMFTR